MKRFTATTICVPSEHYMVDLSKRIEEIEKLVEAGKCFTISRARRFGKTTTIDALCSRLAERYVVINLDLKDIEDGCSASGGQFSQAFARTA